MSTLWPRQCISTHGTFASARKGIIAVSARPPETSLTITAPASTALLATSARMVSILTGIPAPESCLDYRNHPAQLLLDRHALRTRAR